MEKARLRSRRRRREREGVVEGFGRRTERNEGESECGEA